MSWEPINLAKLEPRPASLPSIGGVNLIYPGKRHVFSGPPESAKTIAAYAIIIEEILRGGTVLLIDFEMGQWDARDRLREMGATDEVLGHLFYIEPEVPAGEEIIDDLVSRWTFTLVVIDAAAGAYSLQGLDDNKRGDVEAFARIFVSTFWLRGVATIVLDHVAKNAGGRGAFAIGSERKIGGSDVHLGFEVVRPIKRGGRGLYKIVTHKDRFGHLHRPKAAEFELHSDPDTHAITWTFREPEPSAEGDPFRPTGLMEKVSMYVESCGDVVSRAQVERNVHGRSAYVRLALDTLISEGYLEQQSGPHQSRPVRSVRIYQEASDFVPKAGVRSDSDQLVSGEHEPSTPSPDKPHELAQPDLVPTSSPPRPDEVGHRPHDLVPRRPSLEGDEVGDVLAQDELAVAAGVKRNGLVGRLVLCSKHGHVTSIKSVSAGVAYMACGCFVVGSEEKASSPPTMVEGAT